MGQIIEFPGQTSKFGYKRVPKRRRNLEDPSQLPLFPQPTAQILQFTPKLGAFEQALFLDERGDPRAVESYVKAIADQDCVADAFCNWGIIESNQGRTAKAFDCFTNALKHNPRHSEAHYNLGNMYFEVNDFRLAQVHYQIAVEVDPSFPNVYFNLGLVLSINKETGAAVTALSNYQELVPADERKKAEELFQNLKRSLAEEKKAKA